ncbi:MAG: glycoside hydrolase family 16 protein [Bacteroidota bacterium]
MKKKGAMNANRNFTTLVMIAVLMIFSSCENDTSQEVTTLNNLVWADEFNVDGAPDPQNWTYEIGTGQNGWGNNELQYYTDRSENIKVENGFLVITAREESFQGSDYTSARIITKDKREFEYGRFEARMKMPWGQGIWPAFWMLGADIDQNPWPGAGEIDVMEYLGQDPTITFGTIHGPGYSGGESVSKKYDLGNSRFDTKFHVFGIEWGPGFVNFYVDDVLYGRLTPEDIPEGSDWVFDKPFFLLLNMAIGGTLPGSPDQNTVFPQTLIVDYVRVYSFE